MLNLNNKKEVFALLAQGTVLLTPNNRLSARLLQGFYESQTHKSLAKPLCMPYKQFLTQTYEKLGFLYPHKAHPILINEAQYQHLWREIIKKDPLIPYSEGLLTAVIQAYEYCEQWRLDSQTVDFSLLPQTEKFQQWWMDFNSKLNKSQLINLYQLIPYLIESSNSYPSTTQPLHKSIIWACFDEFNPQQSQMQHYLQAQGLEQYIYDLKPNDSSPKLFAAQDSTEEYQQLLEWLDLRINSGDQCIGVVVPDLEKESALLQRMMGLKFEPQLLDFTLGSKLHDYPLIAHALCWLQLEKTTINYEQVSLILLSPFHECAQDNFIALSEYLEESSLIYQQDFSLSSLIKELEFKVPSFALLLKALQPYPKKASVQQWVQLFQERLHQIGFPGKAALDSKNYQCFNRFKELFNDFAQLSLITPELSTQEALETLVKLTKQTIFQAQKKNALIQVSGLLEASGCEFDSLWVCGLTEMCLPEKTALSAFIPIHLQRQLSMPHSLPAKELLFAEQILGRLQAGSKETVFSYPQFKEDAPYLPCSLIKDLKPYTALAPKELTFEPLELREENYLIPLQEQEQIKGGTALLANQAKCPFKAFAEYRLKAKPSLTLEDPLNGKQKGQVLHKAMELIWTQLGSQKALLEISEQALEQLLDQSIILALNSQLPKDSFPKLVLELEHKRLKNLIKTSLLWEKERPPFTVLSLEEAFNVELAGLHFKVRIDRLDQVEGGKWVIDYKSTLPVSKPWKEDRPKEPQLLLYALLDEHINTLVFLQLKTGAFQCQGLTEASYSVEGLYSLQGKESWTNTRAGWQQQLYLLAQEIQDGHCEPNPLNSSICQHCDFQNLCRFSSVI